MFASFYRNFSSLKSLKGYAIYSTIPLEDKTTKYEKILFFLLDSSPPSFQYMREEGCKVFVIADGRLRAEGEGFANGMSPGGVTAKGGGGAQQVRQHPANRWLN